MPPSTAPLREALAETCRSLAELAGTLSPQQWALPTGCPGWTVFDQVAHVSSLESVMAGIPPIAHQAGPRAHVRNSIGARMEDLVDARRGWDTERLVAELREVTRLRQLQLVPLDDVPDATVSGPTGTPMPIAAGLVLRTFDCVAHEQDVRRAVGRPGGLDGAAAAVVSGRIVELLHDRWSRQDAAEVELAVDGTVSRLVLGDGGPSVSLACSGANLIALATGRGDVDASVVRVGGDAEIAGRLLAAMTLTP